MAIFIFVCWRILFSDCDLILQLAEKFGKSPASLAGKVVWITGASSGIGEFTAYELAKAGCRLVLSARRKEELERVKSQCLVSGKVKDDDVLVLPLDMLKTDTHAAAVETVLQHFSKIDILFSNAGRSHRGMFESTSLDVDREMFELTVFGNMSLIKATLPSMKERKEGHIFVMSSAAGKLGAPASSPYTGAKHALQGYCDCLRMELIQYNIDVSVVCPGPVHSNLLQYSFTEKSGEFYGKAWSKDENRMTTSRCAELIGIMMANKLGEGWISPQPILALMYFNQYLPWPFQRVFTRMGMKAVAKMRDGDAKEAKEK
ncbi:hypothetical protein ScPMuIL_013971 [Solemya velum]